MRKKPQFRFYVKQLQHFCRVWRTACVYRQHSTVTPDGYTRCTQAQCPRAAYTQLPFPTPFPLPRGLGKLAQRARFQGWCCCLIERLHIPALSQRQSWHHSCRAKAHKLIYEGSWGWWGSVNNFTRFWESRTGQHRTVGISAGLSWKCQSETTQGHLEKFLSLYNDLQDSCEMPLSIPAHQGHTESRASTAVRTSPSSSPGCTDSCKEINP